MDKFVEKTYEFNKIGQTPIDDSYGNILDAVNLVGEEFKEIIEALDKYEISSKTDCKDTKLKRKTELVKELIDLQVTAIGACYRLGLNRHQTECGMYLVGDSNLSKFDDTEEDAQKSVEKLIDEGRYEQVQYKPVEGRFVIFGKTQEGGYKILKSHTTWKAEEKLKQIISLEDTSKEVEFEDI